jgi:hypothetical protein
VTANGSQRRVHEQRPPKEEKVDNGHFPADIYDSSSSFTVDGIPLLPGECWQDYHSRAMAWITIEAATVPANSHFLSRRQFFGRLLIIPILAVMAFLITPYAR